MTTDIHEHVNGPLPKAVAYKPWDYTFIHIHGFLEGV